VDMFFVISGFLIAASLQRNSVQGYLASRALRILPALIVCVGLSTFVLGPLLTTSADYWRNPQTWQYFTHNATLHRAEFFLPGVFEQLPRTAINGSLWTLPIEAQLYIALLIAGLLGMIDDAGADPHRLRIEITEVALLDDAPRALRMLNALRSRGVLSLLDDFGTGFSALSYLHRFPIQALKIDRSFVAGLDGETRAESLALVRAILALAGTLGIDTIGEGIETIVQRDTLTELGCLFGQGYLFGRPMGRTAG